MAEAPDLWKHAILQCGCGREATSNQADCCSSPAAGKKESMMGQPEQENEEAIDRKSVV